MQEKILVIGKKGLLARSVINYLKIIGKVFVVISPSSSENKVDITKKEKLVESLDAIKPNVIINCSGTVNLDFCEKNPVQAWNLNTIAVFNIINWVKRKNCKYIGISTDQVYDLNGSKENNRNVIYNQYAASKYCAEKIALTHNNSLVIRTNIVGIRGSTDHTFFEWIIEMLKKKKRFDLFPDYYNSSIDVKNFSKILIDLHESGFKGVINVGSREYVSKAEFIKRVAKRFGFREFKYRIASVEDLTIQRSKNCGMNVGKVEKILNYNMPTIDEVIESLFKEINEEEL